MMRFVSMFLLSVSAIAQSGSVVATWHGEALVKEHKVPLTLKITGNPNHLNAALLNCPDSNPATKISLEGDHLVVTFNYYAKNFDVTLDHGTLQGTFGNTTTRYPVTLTQTPVALAPNPKASIQGDWEVAVKSVKGESAWTLHVNEGKGNAPNKAVIQRIDGDTGSLYGFYNPATKSYQFSHFTAYGPALYSVAPQKDGTLLLSNLLNDQQTNLTARRPEEARKQNLPTVTDPTQQTTLKDPNTPLRFSYPDLSGKLVSNTDPQFRGKVVIVTIGGSWCPNCHDEAPFFEELYKKFHSKGLEIVDLSFEEGDQLKNPTRLHSFVNRYGLTYNVLLAGEPDDLPKKITVANNLNCWPTSFFIGRDGRIKQIHAGFAGPANPAAHAELKKEVTELLENLLTQPIPLHSASR